MLPFYALISMLSVSATPWACHHSVNDQISHWWVWLMAHKCYKNYWALPTPQIYSLDEYFHLGGYSCEKKNIWQKAHNPWSPVHKASHLALHHLHSSRYFQLRPLLIFINSGIAHKSELLVSRQFGNFRNFRLFKIFLFIENMAILVS